MNGKRRRTFSFDNPVYTIPMEEIMSIIRKQLDVGCSIRFSPRGISMLPMLREGYDSVVLSPLKEKLKRYDLVLYRRSNGEYVLHRIFRVGETYTCLGDNQLILERGLRHDQIIAIVTAYYRCEKLYKMNNFPYYLYCRIWCGSLTIRRFLMRFVKFFRYKIFN